MILWLWRKGEVKGDTAVVPWAAILFWTFVAALAALTGSASESLSPLLLAGLCAVLVVLGATLAHYAFSQGYLSRHFFREAGRRALALAGARAYVWDWQPEEGELHVSPEIERALGQPPGILAEAGAEAFLEIMHPADRTAYLTAIEEAEASGRGSIEKEFRLLHGDGEYRWFMLRARAMPGHGRRAARCIGTLTDVTIAKRSEERLLTDAVYDRVTGLPNRALFLDRLTRALPGCRRRSRRLSCCWSTSTASRSSTMRWATRPATRLLTVVGRRLHARRPARWTASPGCRATSSPSSSPKPRASATS